MRTKNARKRLKGAFRSAFHYSWVLFSHGSLESLLPPSDIWGIKHEIGLDTLSIWSLRGWQCTLPVELVSYPRVWSLSSDVRLFSSTFQTPIIVTKIMNKNPTDQLLLRGMQFTYRKFLKLYDEPLGEVGKESNNYWMCTIC